MLIASGAPNSLIAYNRRPIATLARASVPVKYSRIYQFTNPDETLLRQASVAGSNNDESHELVYDKLRSVFLTHVRRQFGIFNPDIDNITTSLLRDYAEGHQDPEKLCDQLAERYESLLPPIEHSIHDYLWIVIDTSGDSDVVYLFLLKHEDSHHITPSLTVTSSPALFLNRLLYGARIHLQEWLQAESRTYLSLLCPKNQQPQAVAFGTLIGWAEGIDRATKTEEFLDTIESFATTLPPEKAQETRERVIDYCMEQSRQGKPVDLEMLSEHVNEEAPKALLDFVKEKGDDPYYELYTDRNKLKRYTRFYGRDQDLTIGFSTSMLGGQISYDENSDTLVIKSIPKALKSQLKQFLKK